MFVKPFYTFTITGEPDEDYRQYLARRLRESLPDGMDVHACDVMNKPDALPLDISMDDLEGDVVAGIAAVTYRGTLYIDMLWIHPSLCGQGIGPRLVRMAEEAALQRGCTRARLTAVHRMEFYTRIGYGVTGKLQQFPHGHTIYCLAKDLAVDAISLDAVNHMA